jgi:hypothetical protein
MRWLALPLLIIGLALAAWMLDPFKWTSGEAARTLEQKPVHENLNDRQKQIIDMLVERNKLIISISTLIIGGTLGLLVTIVKDVKSTIPRSCWATLLMSWLALGGSTFGGYKHYERLALMLDYQFFEPFHGVFERWATMQFWLFLVGLFLSAVFILQVVSAVRRH